MIRNLARRYFSRRALPISHNTQRGNIDDFLQKSRLNEPSKYSQNMFNIEDEDEPIFDIDFDYEETIKEDPQNVTNDAQIHNTDDVPNDKNTHGLLNEDFIETPVQKLPLLKIKQNIQWGVDDLVTIPRDYIISNRKINLDGGIYHIDMNGQIQSNTLCFVPFKKNIDKKGKNVNPVLLFRNIEHVDSIVDFNLLSKNLCEKLSMNIDQFVSSRRTFNLLYGIYMFKSKHEGKSIHLTLYATCPHIGRILDLHRTNVNFMDYEFSRDFTWSLFLPKFKNLEKPSSISKYGFYHDTYGKWLSTSRDLPEDESAFLNIIMNIYGRNLYIPENFIGIFNAYMEIVQFRQDNMINSYTSPIEGGLFSKNNKLPRILDINSFLGEFAISKYLENHHSLREIVLLNSSSPCLYEQIYPKVKLIHIGRNHGHLNREILDELNSLCKSSLQFDHVHLNLINREEFLPEYLKVSIPLVIHDFYLSYLVNGKNTRRNLLNMIKSIREDFKLISIDEGSISWRGMKMGFIHVRFPS